MGFRQDVRKIRGSAGRGSSGFRMCWGNYFYYFLELVQTAEQKERIQPTEQEPIGERRQRMKSCDRGIKAIWDERNTKF